MSYDVRCRMTAAQSLIQHAHTISHSEGPSWHTSINRLSRVHLNFTGIVAIHYVCLPRAYYGRQPRLGAEHFRRAEGNCDINERLAQPIGHLLELENLPWILTTRQIPYRQVDPPPCTQDPTFHPALAKRMSAQTAVTRTLQVATLMSLQLRQFI